MANATRDLIRGGSDPSTVQTYTPAKKYVHSGVTGSSPVKDLNKPVNAITPQVMQENNSSVEKIVKDRVALRNAGEGMPANAGSVKASGTGGKGAGMLGKGSNVNHA